MNLTGLNHITNTPDEGSHLYIYSEILLHITLDYVWSRLDGTGQLFKISAILTENQINKQQLTLS